MCVKARIFTEKLQHKDGQRCHCDTTNIVSRVLILRLVEPYAVIEKQIVW